jgi:putative oxidoreductase
MRFGALIIRAVVGPLFIGHGTQKLFGWFGGHGVEGTGGFFEQLGLRPGKRHAVAAGAAETAGGALLTPF